MSFNKERLLLVNCYAFRIIRMKKKRKETCDLLSSLLFTGESKKECVGEKSWVSSKKIVVMENIKREIQREILLYRKPSSLKEDNII